MSDSRKEFEAALLASNPQASVARHDSLADQYANLYVQSTWEGWQLALSATPAPVAALTETFVQQVPDHCDRIVWRNGYYHLPVNSQSESVQEGPKGVESDLLEWCRENGETVEAGNGSRVMVPLLRLQKLFAGKQLVPLSSPAQSIPAAPCQCKPDETTGWTDDDIMVPRCNVCGLVVMKIIAERKAARALAAIDEEGQEVPSDELVSGWIAKAQGRYTGDLRQYRYVAMKYAEWLRGERAGN